MGSLIIRPKDDDSLKLQNDAGTTILELANDESKLRLAQNNISASDGTTVITTSGANVTLAGTANNIGTVTSGTFNGTIGSSANMPSGTVIKMGQTKFTGDAYQANSTSYSGFVNAPSFTPNGGPNNTSTIYAFANLNIEAAYTDGANNLKGVKFQIIGDDITNVTTSGTLVGTVDYGGSGSQIRYWFITSLQGVTLDGTWNAAITVGVAVANNVASNNSSITVYGNDTFDESYITFIEVV